MSQFFASNNRMTTNASQYAEAATTCAFTGMFRNCANSIIAILDTITMVSIFVILALGLALVLGVSIIIVILVSLISLLALLYRFTPLKEQPRPV